MGNAILEILEEMKIKQTEQAKQLVELSKHKEPTREEPLPPPEPQIHKYIHRLEFSTSKWLIVTSTLTLFLVGSTVLHYNQHQAIQQIEINDLKYRYIKMKGVISAVELLKLDTLTANEMQKTRVDVMKYEKLVQEQAMAAARTIQIQRETTQLKERQ